MTWSGERTLKVVERTSECRGIVSLRLASADGSPLPPFEPGQYLTFNLDVPGQDRPVIRCYSLSDAPADTYRITVKRVGKGLASTHINVALEPGDTLVARDGLGLAGMVKASVGRISDTADAQPKPLSTGDSQ